MNKQRTAPLLEREEISGSGIYCFFPFDQLDKNGCGVFKIGMTTHFDNRIKNYHTYLPKGVYYKCFLKNPSKKKNGMDTASYYITIEKEIFEDVKSLGGQVITMDIRKHNYGETEWIYASERMIEDAFTIAYGKYGGVKTDLDIGTLEHLAGLRQNFERNKVFKGEIYF